MRLAGPRPPEAAPRAPTKNSGSLSLPEFCSTLAHPPALQGAPAGFVIWEVLRCAILAPDDVCGCKEQHGREDGDYLLYSKANCGHCTGGGRHAFREERRLRRERSQDATEVTKHQMAQNRSCQERNEKVKFTIHGPPPFSYLLARSLRPHIISVLCLYFYDCCGRRFINRIIATGN